MVTGAADGLGRALVELIVSRGAAVAAWDRNEAGLSRLQREVGSRTLSIHPVDVSDPTSVLHAARATLDDHGTVDVLINNAGITMAAPIDQTDLADFARVMDVNFWGALHCTRALLSTLRGRPSAAVVNVLSVFAWWAFPTKAAYCSAKSALRAFTESLQVESTGTPLLVTAVYPGAIATSFVQNAPSWRPASRAVEHAFLSRWGRSPQQVAMRILRAVERGQRRVRIGLDAVAIDLLVRWAPATSVRLLGRWQHQLPFLPLYPAGGLPEAE